MPKITTKLAMAVAFYTACPLAVCIDQDALVRQMARNEGIPAKMLRTPAQVAVFRKRSAAAKLGWRRRRRRPKK